jgi:hypothetical protein
MAFWRLKRNETNWQEYRAMVVRAPSESVARETAHDVESEEESSIGESSDWMNPTLTTCIEISVEGMTQVIWADFKEG